MAADYKLPLTINKHVRFFDGQFLQDQDFIDEQKYNQSRRQQHNRTLHIGGVVEGLTVYKPDGSSSVIQVKVRPGTAIDTDGRFICLSDYSAAIDMPEGAAGTTRWLYIAYHQVPSDLPTTSQGVEEETRWLDAPYIFSAANQLGIDDEYDGPDWNGYLNVGPPPPVLLAKLIIANNGALTIDESVRIYSGLRLPGPATLGPALRTDSSGNVGLWQVDNNDLTERLTISPAGNVGINATSPAAALEIGSTLKASKNGEALIGLKVAPVFNINGKEAVGKYGLLVTNGYVGIGTTTPQTNLEVRGVMRGGVDASNYTEVSHGGSHGYINTVGNGRLDFRHDGSNRMVLTSEGQVGIGLDVPGAYLDVKGTRNTANHVAIQLRSGNSSANFDSNQLTFGYNNTTNYRHAIKTRHKNNGRSGNAIDFYVWKYISDEDQDQATDIGTQHAMTLDGGFAGIGITSPGGKLHVVHEAQDAGGNTLVLGPTNGSNLRLGYHTNYSWMQSHGSKPLVINTLGNNVGIATTAPNATLDINGSFRANSHVSGERELYMEAPSSADHRGDGVVQNATGLVYRVANNPGDGEPILQVRSTGQAIRFFVEHNGWTGSPHNSAWFGGSFDNYFAGKVGIGTSTPGEKLEVTGRVKAQELSIGPWPASNQYVFFGANSLDQTKNANYALLQASSTDTDVGRTYLNSPVDIRFRISNSDKMILANNGNVGIGTTDPDTLLTVGNGGTGDLLKFNTARAWQFRTKDSGASTKLELQSLVNGKAFRVVSPDGTVALQVDTEDGGGRVQARLWYSDEYTWNQGDSAVKMKHSDKSVAFLTYVRGKFEGTGEYVRVWVGSDGFWYLGGASAQSGVTAKARCIGMP